MADDERAESGATAATVNLRGNVATFTAHCYAPGGAERLAAFKADHDSRHGTREGAIGGRYSYVFTPTSLGTFVDVICNECRASAPLADGDDF